MFVVSRGYGRADRISGRSWECKIGRVGSTARITKRTEPEFHHALLLQVAWCFSLNVSVYIYQVALKENMPGRI